MKNIFIRAMSFNVRVECDTGTEAWGSRLDNLIRLILDSGADLIGVQEARKNQYTDMIKNLGDFGSVGAGRDDGGEEGEHVPIFYRKSRFILKDTGTFWLSDTPEKPSIGWDAEFNRICTFAVLKDLETQKEFTHYNTHLDHLGQTAILEGARLINKTVLDKKTPALVTGDFNTSEHSEPYKAITRQGLCDAKFTAKSGMSHGTFHAYKPSDTIRNESPIDYILHTGDFAAEDYRVLINGSYGEFTSDHYPVMATFFQL